MVRGAWRVARGFLRLAPAPRATRHAPRATIILVLALICCGLAGFAAHPCSAQSRGPDGVYYSREKKFHIPFKVDAGEKRIRQIQLYVSEDRGRSWKQVATAQPEDNGFTYQAQGDGHYWFTVRTIDQEGRTFPPSLEQAQPG